MSTLDPELREQLLRLAATDQDARKRLGRHPRLHQGVAEQQLTAAERADLKHMRGPWMPATPPGCGRSSPRAAGPAAAWSAPTAPRRPGCWSSMPTTTRPSSVPALSCWGQAVQAGEADARHHAYPTDRVRLAGGNKQVYGTQVMVVGAWQPRPLADPDRVDERRRQVGLEPLADYGRRFEQSDPQGGKDQATV